MVIVFHNEPDGQDPFCAVGSQHGTRRVVKPPEILTRLDVYLKQFSAMRAGKIRSTLEKQQSFSGSFHKRHVYAEMLAACNKTVQVNPMENRVYTDLDAGVFYMYADVTKTFADYLQWLIWEAAPVFDLTKSLVDQGGA